MDRFPVNTLRLLAPLLRLLVGVWLMLAAVPAMAQDGAASALVPLCHGYADTAGQAAALKAGNASWICSDDQWRARSRHALLRFELGAAGKVPAELTTRLARFESVQVTVERPDGQVASYALPAHSFVQRGHMVIAAKLPDAGSPARRITIDLIGATAAPLMSMARLQAAPVPQIGLEQLWIAMLCGLLLVPLIFNLALFRALGDRFLLWHVAMVAFMLGHTVISSGLLPLVAPVPVGTVSLLVVLTFCGGAASALMLTGEFIEPDKLDPANRRWLRYGAIWLIFNAAFYAAAIDWLQGDALQVYLLNWLVVVAILVAAMAQALYRGSRSAKFLFASLVPLIVTGLWQIGETLTGDHSEPALLFVAQRLAIGAEVLITSIGIADRFIQLRRDRDDHRLLADELLRLAERDPLTGLLNRRAIEERFAVLRAKGFATLALLDLDHFKAVNDHFGHTTGDAVLRAVGAALPEDRDALAVRMGGEEFMLLLRGKDAVQRAEQVRQVLTARIARDVVGLDRPVTASMGLVEIPAEVMPDATFAAIYARADGLLYQAKRAGRNRTVRERMTVFGRQTLPRSKSAA